MMFGTNVYYLAEMNCVPHEVGPEGFWFMWILTFEPLVILPLILVLPDFDYCTSQKECMENNIQAD
jgi:hypothetical protein